MWSNEERGELALKGGNMYSSDRWQQVTRHLNQNADRSSVLCREQQTTVALRSIAGDLR